MNQELQESGGLDRFFFGSIDGKPTLFVLHPDRSICIASIQPTLVESTNQVLAELRGLAAA